MAWATEVPWVLDGPGDWVTDTVYVIEHTVEEEVHVVEDEVEDDEAIVVDATKTAEEEVRREETAIYAYAQAVARDEAEEAETYARTVPEVGMVWAGATTTEAARAVHDVGESVRRTVEGTTKTLEGLLVGLSEALGLAFEGLLNLLRSVFFMTSEQLIAQIDVIDDALKEYARRKLGV